VCENKNKKKKEFTQMCVLAGCDYLDSVDGIGVVKANKILNRGEIRTEKDVCRFQLSTLVVDPAEIKIKGKNRLSIT